ncbi:MAG: hypothetical protein ACLFMQ_07330 [Desulfohalobiaceae bacterium]
MSTIMPEEKKIQDALKWISGQKEEQCKSERLLVQEAAFRFNLTPKQEQYLLRLYFGQDEAQGE